jgi:hypothetical protein
MFYIEKNNGKLQGKWLESIPFASIRLLRAAAFPVTLGAATPAECRSSNGDEIQAVRNSGRLGRKRISTTR